MVIIGNKQYQDLVNSINDINKQIKKIEQSIQEDKEETANNIKEINDKVKELSTVLENNIEDISNRKSVEQIYEEYFFGDEKKDE